MTDSSEERRYSCGDIVIDSEDDDPNEAVVVNTPNVEASEWDVESRGCTLDEDNPEYPADDPVVAVVFRDDLEEQYPFYTGVKPLKLGDIVRTSGIHFYAFPASRLSKVDYIRCHEIPLAKINPSPYHSRQFSREDNAEFIEEVEERGHPGSYPLLRPVGDEFEIVNGHKRVWICRLVGLDSVKCRVAYLDDWEAVTWFSERHLSTDIPEREECTDQEIRETIQLMRERWGDRIEEIPEVEHQLNRLGEAADDNEMQDLAEFLRDRGMDVEIQDGRVVGEKLGEVYEIEPDGTVSSGGALRARLEDLIEGFLEDETDPHPQAGQDARKRTSEIKQNG